MNEDFEFRISNFEFFHRPPGFLTRLGGKFEIRNSKFEIGA